ncbi:MAG: hypothetical protein CME62_15845 [Halobacteriovoraceae bacterium]|nr:hypothetical protein [Halobacteriovoraceae bacterium]|tara:strand:+ start:5922 stop:7514 length:1593 start_codon:yes stop_codon:yes gene_type:complete
MKLLVLLGMMIATTFALAEERRIIQIHENGEYLSGHITLFLDNGEIVHFDNKNKDLMAQARAALKSNFYISINKLTDRAEQSDLIDKIVLENPASPITSSIENENEKEMYNPQRYNSIRWTSRDPIEKSNITTLRDYDHAQQIMNTMNGNTHDDSQCYNRAHMWTYDALVENRVNLGKLWLFFTRRYIREYNYKWWFHVTPFTEVGAERHRYALDRGFTQIPYAINNWTNIFMKNDATCKVVNKYTDYENNQNTQYCYLMYSSQYYWQPWQLENLTKKGEHYYGYKENELKISYRDALRRRWNRRIPVLRNPLPNPDIDGPSDEPRDPDPRVDPPTTRPDRPEPRPDRPRPDRPRNTRGVDRDLSPGEVVYDIARGTVKVKVLDHQASGLYYIEHLEGRMRGQRESNRSRRDFAIMDGCYRSVCIGENMYTITRDVDAVKVIGLQANGNYVLSFERGGFGNNWSFNQLAKRKGCGREFCVGDQAYNRQYRNSLVRIIGIQPNGLYILSFETGPYAGRRGENWHASYLIRR